MISNGLGSQEVPEGVLQEKVIQVAQRLLPVEPRVQFLQIGCEELVAHCHKAFHFAAPEHRAQVGATVKSNTPDLELAPVDHLQALRRQEKILAQVIHVAKTALTIFCPIGLTTQRRPQRAKSAGQVGKTVIVPGQFF
ncbi:hypothetical protein D9M72_603940 [compost metagenome]